MKKLALLMALFSTLSNAATANLDISTTLQTTCTFGSNTPGVFGYDAAAPSILNTSASGGNAATIALTYVGTPTVTVSEITSFTATPNGYSGTPTFTNTLNNSAGSLTYSSGSANYVYSSGSSDTYILNLRAVNNGGNPFPMGTYSARAVITCN